MEHVRVILMCMVVTFARCISVSLLDRGLTNSVYCLIDATI